jgi:hypothetical protein
MASRAVLVSQAEALVMIDRIRTAIPKVETVKMLTRLILSAQANDGQRGYPQAQD